MTVVSNQVFHEKLQAWPEAHEAYVFGSTNEAAAFVPTPKELGELWQYFYDESAEMIETVGVYGVMRRTDGERPWCVASIDLCEVTRKTCESFMSLGGFTIEHAGESYGYGVPYDVHTEPETVTHMVQAIMIRDQVEPVDGIEEIHQILRDARESGVYIVANTSTLPGCELPTVKWLAKYLPDSFDGIVLPRNFDGNGEITKGDAKATVMNALATVDHPETITRTLHIDDAPHHIRAVRSAVAKLGSVLHADLTPIYPWNVKHDDMNHRPTPLSCFETTAELLADWKSQ